MRCRKNFLGTQKRAPITHLEALVYFLVILFRDNIIDTYLSMHI